MQSPFELKGYWWLPNLEENKLPGTLTFSQEDGASLEILGVFDIKKTPQVEKPIIILGNTQQGKPITLYKCFYTHWIDSLTGLGGSKYHVHVIFEGVQFDSEDKIKFHELYGSYTDLDAWVGIYGFTIEYDHNDGKFISKVKYEKPASQFFDINDDFEVGIGFSSHGPGKSIIQTEVKISQRACFIVKSKNGGGSFDDLFAQLNIFSSLLQFAVQRIPYPISVFGLSQENSQQRDGKEPYYPEVKIYYEPIESILSQKEKLPQEFLFTFGDLTAEQIVAWFASFDKYQTVIYLYRSLFYSNRLFIDTKFLSIAQAIESLHSILNNANRRVFKVRILELLTNKKVFINQLISDIDLFAERVRDTRNEFVHHDKHPLTFQKEELLSAIYLLTIVVEIYLLGIIGVSDEKVKELIEPKIQSHLTSWKHLRTIKK